MPHRSQAEACGIATVNGMVTTAVAMAIDPRQLAIYLAALCERHRRIAINGLLWMANANGIPLQTLLVKVSTACGVKGDPFG